MAGRGEGEGERENASGQRGQKAFSDDMLEENKGIHDKGGRCGRVLRNEEQLTSLLQKTDPPRLRRP